MKKLFLLVSFFLTFSAYSQGEYHVRLIIPVFNQSTGNPPVSNPYRQVIDLNNIPELGFKNKFITLSNSIYYGSFTVNTYPDLSDRISLSWKGNISIPARQDYFHEGLELWNSISGVPQEVIFEVRYNAVAGSGREFDKHDRIFDAVTFIDTDSNGSVGFYDIYKHGSDPKTYPTATYYWSDTNNDGDVDSGELFEDNAGSNSVTTSPENIPVRGGLGDTDGDGTDEGDDEEDKDEIELDDKMPAFSEFKSIVGIDSLQIPTSQDITFTINTTYFDHTFQGFGNDSTINNFRLAFRDLVSLLFTWFFIRSIITTFRQW